MLPTGADLRKGSVQWCVSPSQCFDERASWGFFWVFFCRAVFSPYVSSRRAVLLLSYQLLGYFIIIIFVVVVVIIIIIWPPVIDVLLFNLTDIFSPLFVCFGISMVWLCVSLDYSLDWILSSSPSQPPPPELPLPPPFTITTTNGRWSSISFFLFFFSSLFCIPYSFELVTGLSIVVTCNRPGTAPDELKGFRGLRLICGDTPLRTAQTLCGPGQYELTDITVFKIRPESTLQLTVSGQQALKSTPSAFISSF